MTPAPITAILDLDLDIFKLSLWALKIETVNFAAESIDYGK
jgi:hypothetical protein